MNDILEKEYDEKLIDFLIYTEDIDLLLSKEDVLNKILTTSFANKFLTKLLNLYSDNNAIISTEDKKKNILTVMNAIRFDCKFNSEQEKKYIWDNINIIIRCLNCAKIDYFKYNSSNNELIDIRYNELVDSFVFFIIYYYLKNKDDYNDDVIEFFAVNADLYVFGLGRIIKEHDKILDDEQFLDKTRTILNNSLDFLKNDEYIVQDKGAKTFIKMLKEANKVFK